MTSSILIFTLLFALAVSVATLRGNAMKSRGREQREFTEKQLQDELYAIAKALEKIRACIEEGRNDKAIPPLIEISELLGKFSAERFSSLEWKEFYAAQFTEFQCLSEFLNENAKEEIAACRRDRELRQQEQAEIAKKEFVRKKLVPNIAVGTLAAVLIFYVIFQLVNF